MAFDSVIESAATDTFGPHDALDICACAMCANGGEDEWGVDGIYNVAYESQSAADIDAILAATGKPIFTWDQAGAQISRWNVKWDDDGTVAGNAFGSPGELTYGFLQGSDLSTDTSNRDYREMTAIEIAFTLVAINEFEEIANLTFIRVEGTGGSDYLDSQLDADMDFQAIDSFNGGWMSGGIDNAVRISNGTQGLADYGSWAYKTAMHEIGHGVGLPHPGDYNGSGATTYENQAVYAQDTYMYTVMSYWSHTITGGDTFETVYDDMGNSAFIGGYATGLLMHDIAALHRLYGANMTTRDGDTVYGFNSTEAADSHWNLDNWDDFFVAAIWDGGGVDTIDASGYYEDQVISLVEESFSSLGGLTYNLSIARGAVIENAIGGAGDDFFVGNASNNTIDGGAGLDTIDYSGVGSGVTVDLSAGTFTIAGQGTDTLISIEGVIGTDFDDVLIGDANNNYFEMGFGTDTITGGDGFDIISLRGANSGVQVTAAFLNGGVITLPGLGTNTFTSIEGLRGTEFRDVFRGDAGLQYYDGGGGDDTFVVSAGGDEYDGGAGSDTLDFRGSATRISLTLYTNTLSDGGDYGSFTFEDFENVLATEGNDFVNASAADNEINTYGGNDAIYAQQGNDLVRAGAGNDYIGGWYGDDTIFGDAGNDRIEGQFGNDFLRGGTGIDTINGGDGEDLVNGDDGDDMLYGDAGNDTMIGGEGVDTMEGGSGDDNMRGNNGNDIIDGGDGNDYILGGNNDDVITGGLGDDQIRGESGVDVLSGDAGEDRLIGGDGNDTLNGGDDDDRLFGQNGDDIMNGDGGDDIMRGGAGTDTMNGGDGIDALFGGGDNDILDGGADNDKLYGGNGNDDLEGGGGNDRLFGQNDDDTLNGGTGKDFLTGGSGVDTFVFEAGDSLMSGRDMIEDYEAGEIIEIAGHTFVGESAFSAGGGFEVRYSSTSGGQTFLELDRDGDGIVDERIDFRGTTEWDFASDGTNISGVVASPGEGDLI
jgi:Ca2+-binding RTX toxin-like protein